MNNKIKLLALSVIPVLLLAGCVSEGEKKADCFDKYVDQELLSACHKQVCSELDAIRTGWSFWLPEVDCTTQTGLTMQNISFQRHSSSVCQQVVSQYAQVWDCFYNE